MSYTVYSTDAFVIRKNNSGENNANVVIYTKKFGKIYASVKGMNSTSSKMRTFLSDGNFVNIEMIRGKVSFIVVGADCDSVVRLTPETRRVFIKILRQIENISTDYQDECVFNTLIEIYQNIENANKEQLASITSVGFAKILSYLGYWEDEKIRSSNLNEISLTPKDISQIKIKIRKILGELNYNSTY